MAGEKNECDQRLPLTGTRVLVIEDEFYIADDLRRTLESTGAVVIGPLSTFGKAKDAIERGGFDCALVDLNLHGVSAAPIAGRLAELAIPFALVTGYGSPAVPEELRGAPCLEKPYDPAKLVALVRRWHEVSAA